MTYATTIPDRAALPATLTARDQWVAWRPVVDKQHPEKKPKKLPIDSSTERAASTSDPATWGPFDEVAAWAKTRRAIAGVGFVFTAGDPFTGIDFDNCRNPETGELFGWQAPWIARLLPVAYCEVSPSGTGVKCWVLATIPEAAKYDDDGVEVYADGRYFTMTGLRLDGCADEPQEAQALVDELMAFIAARFGRPVPELPAPVASAQAQPQEPEGVIDAPGWQGDRQRAITAQLRAWVDAKVDRAKEQMAAAGEGTRHNKRLQLGELLGGVIAAAPGMLSEGEAVSIIYNGKKPESHEADELKAILAAVRHGQTLPLAHDLPREPTDAAPVLLDGRAWCPACRTALRRSSFDYAPGMAPGWYCPQCKGVMRWPLSVFSGAGQSQDSVSAVGGESGERRGRTLVHASRIGEAVERIRWLIPGILPLNALMQIFAPGGSGKSLLALDMALCVAQHAPVVYIAAEAAGEQEDRIVAWCEHHGLGAGQLHYWQWPVILKDHGSVDEFIAAIRELRPAFVLLDPLASCMEGLEESSTGDMTIAVAALNRIREAVGACVGIVHHSGWSDVRERGSSVLRNACRVVIKLLTDDTGLMTITCEKNNNGKPFEARFFRLIESGPGVVPVPASKVSTRSVTLTMKHIAILEALSLSQHRDGANFSQIQSATEQINSTLHKGLHRLLERGLVALEGRTYMLTEAGRQELAAAANVTEVAATPTAPTRGPMVNWQVNPRGEPAPPPPATRYTPAPGFDGAVGGEGESTHQDAEFTEFTVHGENVHSDPADLTDSEFTPDTASGRGSSPEFTVSSLRSSPPEFASSPPPVPYKGNRSELSEQGEVEGEPGEPTPPTATPDALGMAERLRRRKEEMTHAAD
jgi:hypothetical protein